MSCVAACWFITSFVWYRARVVVVAGGAVGDIMEDTLYIHTYILIGVVSYVSRGMNDSHIVCISLLQFFNCMLLANLNLLLML